MDEKTMNEFKIISLEYAIDLLAEQATRESDYRERGAYKHAGDALFRKQMTIRGGGTVTSDEEEYLKHYWAYEHKWPSPIYRYDA